MKVMSFKRLKFACYTANITMSVVTNLPPVLFITFRNLYGFSYSLLGLLVLINYVTQLLVDLVFSFFSHKFNITKAVKMTPVIVVIGLLIYSVWPLIFPQSAYAGIVIGTVIFSVSAGLAEVLISPVIAAIPSNQPDREMSKLHSVYAWGVVGVIIISTVFLLIFGGGNWQWLAITFITIPLISAILFSGTEIPKMETPTKDFGAFKLLKNKKLWISVIGIFLGGAAECTMAQWSSGYLEQALGIEKVWGDIFGVAVFAVMMGLGRTLYSRIGKSIGRVLFFGVVGATVCYFTAAVSNIPIIGLLSCAITGFCVSMLWPGSLIVASDRFQDGGVFLYALMAAGGDLGASVGPQLVGIVTDMTIASPSAMRLAERLNLSCEQLGMKFGMLAGMLFPLVAIFVFLYIWKTDNKKHNNIEHPPKQ